MPLRATQERYGVDKKLIVNANVSETRIALLEGERVAELYIERHSSKGLVGSIYKAKVTRVLPGMQSAFVNIGLDRSAFLYGGDVLDADLIREYKRDFDLDESRESHANRKPIEDLIKVGQEILVQVAKEPLGSKGPRVTMLISVPGRYLVLMPDINSIGISRRITDEQERERLRSLMERIKPPTMGIIVRTAGENVDESLLLKDLEYLQKTWANIADRRKLVHSPALLYNEPNIILKTTRDLYSDEVSQIVVDDEQAYQQLRHFLTDTIPGASARLKFYEGDAPVFDAFGVEMDIAVALARKVWLPSGGYIVVDQTEALTSFDVNTGKFVGSSNARDTILKTNMEAVDEIVHQLRVRNIGGIIVLDFIDMEHMEDRERVNLRFAERLKSDKARTNVLSINELGLVQLTRKRTSESLERVMMEPCVYCDGRGRVASVKTEAYNLIRDIVRHVLRTNQKDLRVRAREDIINWLLNEETQLYQGLLDRYGLILHLEKTHLLPEWLQEPSYEILG